MPVEITQNMNLSGILRIEEFFPVDSEDANYDPMLQTLYRGLTQNVFEVNQPSGSNKVYRMTSIRITRQKDWHYLKKK